MPRRTTYALASAAAVLASILLLVNAGAGISAPQSVFHRLATVNGGTAPQFALARTSDGTLHMVWQTGAPTGGPKGIASISISGNGGIGQPVQALSGWDAGIPGLVAEPNGNLEALFGAISPGNVSAVWGVTSGDGGSTWSAPANVKGGGPTESLAYGSDVTAVLAGTTPVMTLPQAGNLVVQRGLGAGMPSSQVNDSAHGALGGVSTAVDSSTGEAVASWASLNANADVIQSVAPSVGPPQVVPGPMKNSVVLAGRDKGAGVFAAYSPDNKHVRLLRYGGGSVAVGSRAGVTTKVLGVATGIDGRIWVMWGDDSGGGIAVTRSNKAVTRFEAIQHFNPDSFTLWRLAGDGRLGPLDLIVHQTPNAKGSVPPTEALYARIRPLLTATFSKTPIKNKQGTVIAVKVVAKVTDAGDAVPSASVTLGKTKKSTNAAGLATFVVQGQGGGTLGVTITAPTYHALTTSLKV
jgi:hypothetical protein